MTAVFMFQHISGVRIWGLKQVGGIRGLGLRLYRVVRHLGFQDLGNVWELLLLISRYRV